MTIVFLTSSGHFVIMLKVSPVGDGAVLVDAIAVTVLYSSSAIYLLNMSSIIVLSRGLLDTCDIPYHMLSSAAVGILSEILDTVVLKYSSSVRSCSCSIPFSD